MWNDDERQPREEPAEEEEKMVETRPGFISTLSFSDGSTSTPNPKLGFCWNFRGEIGF